MIVNTPLNRCAITHAWSYWDDTFSEFELNQIIKICEEDNLIKGETFDGQTDRFRSSKINYQYLNEKNRWIFQRLNGLLYEVNSSFWNFDLAGYEYFQYSTYNAEEQGRYDWHVDCFMNQINEKDGNLHRKLSMSLLLNDDFEGGELQVNTGDAKSVDVPKGRAVFFASHTLHRVTPVTKGIRKSLVLWALGPKFR